MDRPAPPFNDDTELNDLRQKFFLHSSPVLGFPYRGSWVGVKHIGRGGYGQVGLWVKQSVYGEVLDMMATKECIRFPVASTGEWSWDSAAHWVNGVPREAYVQRLLTDSANVVRYRSHSLNHTTETYRIYMEFLPYKDLRTLVENQQNFEVVRRKLKRVQPAHVPEPYMWYIFSCLAQACVDMEGPLHSRNTPAEWTEVVHQDIKTDNILLADPDPDRFPNWAIPKVGDFGGARHTGPDDPVNPIQFWDDAITEGYQPMEHYDWARDPLAPNPEPQNLAYTNIFQVGTVMKAMMDLEEEPEQRVYRTPAGRRTPAFTNHARRNYSRRLINLVRRCIEFLPEDRITPRDLVGETTSQGPNDLRFYPRNVPAGALDMRLERYNTYRMGLDIHAPAMRNESEGRPYPPRHPRAIRRVAPGFQNRLRPRRLPEHH